MINSRQRAYKKRAVIKAVCKKVFRACFVTGFVEAARKPKRYQFALVEERKYGRTRLSTFEAVSFSKTLGPQNVTVVARRVRCDEFTQAH